MKLPNLSYHNERGRLGIRYHIALLQEALQTLDAEGELTTEEEKVFHTKDRIENERLLERNVLYIVSRPALTGYLKAVATHVTTKAFKLNIILKLVNDRGGGRCHGMDNLSTVDEKTGNILRIFHVNTSNKKS